MSHELTVSVNQPYSKIYVSRNLGIDSDISGLVTETFLREYNCYTPGIHEAVFIFSLPLYQILQYKTTTNECHSITHQFYALWKRRIIQIIEGKSLDYFSQTFSRACTRSGGWGERERKSLEIIE